MMTSLNGNIFRFTGPLRGEFTGGGWIPLTKGCDAELWFLFICAWTNSWVNNREAGDLRCHRVNYGVTVIMSFMLRFVVAVLQVHVMCIPTLIIRVHLSGRDCKSFGDVTLMYMDVTTCCIWNETTCTKTQKHENAKRLHISCDSVYFRHYHHAHSVSLTFIDNN